LDHEIIDVLIRSGTKSRPEIICCRIALTVMSADIRPRNEESRGITVCVGFQIVGDPTKKSVPTQVAAKHSDNGTSFEVANMVKYLVYL
jgi:hypothetical protein